MDLTKKITACLVALSVGSGIVPQIVYAIEPTAESQQDNLLQYEVTQEANEKKTQSTISLKLSIDCNALSNKLLRYKVINIAADLA